MKPERTDGSLTTATDPDVPPRTMRSQRHPRLTAVDLFSGCGGMSLGLSKAGFEVLGAVEIDQLAVDTYQSNHSGTHVWHTDIRNLSALSVKRKLGLRKGDLDLLAGCPPCQGFSTVRTLNGSRRICDQRNDLLNDFLRLVTEIMPKAVLLENVPGLATSYRLPNFLRDLRKLGYSASQHILDAANYGVPQRRRRLIVLASRYECIPLPRKAREIRTVRHAIGELKRPGKSGDRLHDLPERRAPHVRALISLIPKNGGSRIDLGDDAQLRCHAECDGFYDIYGRMKWNEVAPTITSGCVNPSKGRFLHPTQNRSITLREAALIQSFPKSYKFSLDKGKFATAAMIGNALPPEFVRRHAAAIHRHLAEQA